MLTILGRATSINVRKVLWCADELGLAFAHEPTGLDRAELRSPAFTALNPNGKVPVIRDGAFVLWESNAICRYLAMRERRTDLLPAEPAHRAVVEQWMDWQTTDLNASWRYAFLALVRGMPPEPDPALLATSIAEWNRHMAMLDERLAATGAYVAGDVFTLADLVLGTATFRWLRSPIERPSLPAVERWFAAIERRPAFVARRWGDEA